MINLIAKVQKKRLKTLKGHKFDFKKRNHFYKKKIDYLKKKTILVFKKLIKKYFCSLETLNFIIFLKISLKRALIIKTIISNFFSKNFIILYKNITICFKIYLISVNINQ